MQEKAAGDGVDLQQGRWPEARSGGDEQPGKMTEQFSIGSD